MERGGGRGRGRGGNFGLTKNIYSTHAGTLLDTHLTVRSFGLTAITKTLC